MKSVAFKLLFYHLSLFIQNKKPIQIILCSTSNRKLVSILRTLEFEKEEEYQIYRLDLEHLDWH